MKTRTSEKIPMNITRAAAPGCPTRSRPPGNRRRQGGFTLIELLVVAGMIGLIALMLGSGLAHTGPNVRAVQCLSNLTQMQAGANMYPADFNDNLLPNAPLGATDQYGRPLGWCPGQEAWTSSVWNTNRPPYTTNGLGPYVTDVKVYKCPGDTIPSDNGPRIRSYSMNGQMLGILPSTLSRNLQNYNPAWKSYIKVADLGGSLPPAKAFVFCEESMYTLNDGYLQLQLSASSPLYPDLPGSYHSGALGLSFADGHAELHQWVDAYVQVLVRYGVTGSRISSSTYDADWLWLRDHAATQK